MKDKDVAKSFLNSLKNRNFLEIQNIFSEEIVFRALLPSKKPFKEANNNKDAADNFKRWYGEKDKFEMKSSNISELGDSRYFISYEIKLHDEDGWQKIYQSIYCNIKDESISNLDLNCSGFIPLNK